MKKSEDRQMMELVAFRFDKYRGDAKRNDPVWVNGTIASFVYDLLTELLEEPNP